VNLISTAVAISIPKILKLKGTSKNEAHIMIYLMFWKHKKISNTKRIAIKTQNPTVTD
jgi:hypothetical protein